MRPTTLLLLAPLVLFLGALRGAAEPPVPAAGSAPMVGGDHAVVVRGDAPAPLVVEGRLVPADAEEVALATRAPRAGKLVEVRPHGTYVNAGDVVARVDDRELARALARAERALAAADRAVRAAEVRARVATDEADVALANARRDHERAREALRAWEEVELPQERRGRELAEQRTAHAIADAEEELRQLEAMYRADELVEATEEIVLQRSRRDLAARRAAAELARARREHAETYSDPLRTARAREAADDAARALSKLGATADVAAAERAATVAAAEVARDEARRDLEELRADVPALVLRAPRAGVVLHGGRADWEEGTPAHHAVGASVASGRGLFLVADPDRLGFRARVTPATHARLGARTAGILRSDWGAEAPARIELGRYVGPDGAFELTAALERALTGHAAGSPARLVVEAGEEDAPPLVVPAAAIHGAEGAPICWVAADGADTYRRVEVTLGARRGAEVEVRAGLAEGDRVLLGAEDGE